MEPGRNPVEDLDIIENELARYGGLEDRPRLIALNKIDVPDGRDISDITIDELRERGLRVIPVSAASGEGLRELTFAMAEIVSRARAEKPVVETKRIVLRPGSADGSDAFTVTESKDGWRVRGEKPERWIRQTDFSNDEAVGYLSDRLNRLGVETALVKHGAIEGDTVLIGDPDDAVVFDFKPGIDSGAEMLGRRGEDQRFEEKRPAHGRRRAIQEGMGDRTETGPAPTSPAASTSPRSTARRRTPWAPRRIPTGSRTTPAPTTTEVSEVSSRAAVVAARRVVVKIGSSSLTTAAGGIDPARVRQLVDAVATLRSSGAEVVLVSSGAIAAGLAPLGLARRPSGLAAQQAAASVGQGLLVHRYTEELARHGLIAGQVLLTLDDVTRRVHYRNAFQTFAKLLELGVVPIVNENDTVATTEIRFGDNDRLAALVAHLVHADLLVLLSDVDGLYDAHPSLPGSALVSDVHAPADLAAVRIGPAGSAGSARAAWRPRSRRPGSPRGPASPSSWLRPSASPRRWRGSRSARSSMPPAVAVPPGCCGWPTPPSPAARSCSTTAPCGPWSNAGPRCWRPVSPA